MRLLIATPLYPPEAGGPASYSYALEQGLPKKGIDVTLMPFSHVRHLPKGIRHLAYAYRLVRAGRGADAILALDPVSVGLPAWIVSLILWKPFYIKIVGDYAWEQGRQRHRMWLPLDEFVKTKDIPFRTRLLREVQVFVTRKAQKVIVPSQYLERIVETWGIRKERITVIYNAVPFRQPQSVSQLVSDTTGPRIITVGRLVPWKGIHTLIKTFVEVKKQVPSATLVIVGEGPEREELERYAQLKLSSEDVVFTGVLSPEDTLATVQFSDVFVLNSTYEGLSHVLIEAMSLRKPIVATDAGGNSELIEDEHTGLLIPVGDKDKLATSIIRLCNDVQLGQSLGRQAHTRSEDFSQERMLDATVALLVETP